MVAVNVGRMPVRSAPSVPSDLAGDAAEAAEVDAVPIPEGPARRERLTTIEGQPPDLAKLPAGCAFAPRCAHAVDRCRVEAPGDTMLGPGHATRCWLHVPA